MGPGLSPAAQPGVAPVPRDLGEGVWQFQSPLWQTNSVLVLKAEDALLCDPAFTTEEVAAIRAEAAERAQSVTHLLLTHADFDHTCGIADFPGAEVVAGKETARQVESGVAAEHLRSAGAEWGVSWRADDIRIDRIVAADTEFMCGRFRVAAIDAASHGREGLAYVLLDQGVLLPGDHLSSITYPLLAGSLRRAIRACERLLEALDAYAPRWVVPGHGPALALDEAKEVGAADLAYLERLAAAARDARSSGLAPGHALLHVYAIEPPRTNTDDFEIYGIRAGNARQALAEIQG